MRTTIDKAGRLVIPRALRDRIGLAEGGEVDLELDGAAVRIEPDSGSDLRMWPACWSFRRPARRSAAMACVS